MLYWHFFNLKEVKSTGNNSWNALCSGPSGVEFSVIRKDFRANLMANWKTTDSTDTRLDQTVFSGSPGHRGHAATFPQTSVVLWSLQMTFKGSQGGAPTAAGAYSPGFKAFFTDSNGHLVLHCRMSSRPGSTFPWVILLTSVPGPTGIGSCWVPGAA